MNNIQIEGFKSIKKLDLNLEPINILIGSNGSGKSNFLSFFDFLKNIYNRNLQEYVALGGGVERYLYNGSKVTEEVEIKLSFIKTNGYSFLLKKGLESFIFVKEGLWYDNPNYENPINIASLSSESNLRFSNIPRAEYIRNYLNALQKYHFHDTGENSPFNRESNIENDKYFLYDRGENIAAFLFNIRETNTIVYNFIVKIIQSIAPYFADFYFQIDASNNLKLRWQSKYSSTIYGPNDLSDGTIRYIALATLFLQPNLPETIIIDEPELGLHPTAITKLSGMIKSAAKKGCQVIVATQSSDLISHFEPSDIITVDQINGESKFKRLNNDDLALWLDDYTLDSLWKQNIITTGQPNY